MTHSCTVDHLEVNVSFSKSRRNTARTEHPRRQLELRDIIHGHVKFFGQETCSTLFDVLGVAAVHHAQLAISVRWMLGEVKSKFKTHEAWILVMREDDWFSRKSLGRSIRDQERISTIKIDSMYSNL